MDKMFPIDPNTADPQSLTKVPGIGAVMADRIRDARPFQSLDDMLSVKGVSNTMLNSWEDYFAIDPVFAFDLGTNASNLEVEPQAFVEDLKENDVEIGAEEMVAEESSSEESSGLEVEAEEAPALVESENGDGSGSEIQTETELPQPGPEDELSEPALEADLPVKVIDEKAPQPSVTRGQALGWAAISALVAIIVSVVATLAVVAAFNDGQLRFATPAQAQQLQAKLDGQETAFQTQQEDLDGLRTRVDNLDTVNTRVSTIEENVSELQTSVGDLDTSLGTLSSDVDTLKEDTTGVSETVATHEQFFISLGELFNQIFSPEAEK